MIASTIALDRFGLGSRPDDPRPSDPKAWLLQQLDRFDPRPQQFAQLPAREQVVEQLGGYIAAQRMAGRIKRQVQPAGLETGMPQPPQQPDAQADALKKYLRQSIQQDY